MKVIIEIDLDINGILDFDDIQYKIFEHLKKLKFRHLTNVNVVTYKEVYI